MVGARLLNSDLSLQTTCITALPSIPNQALGSNYLRRNFPKWSIWGMQPLFQEADMPVSVEAISGACMLAKRAVIEQVGCFSTDYFMYLEDMDLCVKVARTGSRIYYVPEAVIVHHGGGSSSLRKESNFSNIVLRESLIRFFELHRGGLYATVYRASAVLTSLCRIALLAVISPIAIRPKGYQFLSRAASKWCAVFAWSLGLSPMGKPRNVVSTMSS
jgi:N-acetylglucosaminyl-diphospho-decaprenol L-rhamnosyltransferase